MAKPGKTSPGVLRYVPSVDQLLRTDAARELRGLVGIRKLTHIARSVTAEIRDLVQNDSGAFAANGDYSEVLLREAIKRMEASARSEDQAGIKNVINAT